MPPESESREHDVIFDPATGRWWKYTKPNAAGYGIEWGADGTPYMISAFPIEYLQRLRLQNDLFGDDIQLEGLWLDPNGAWRIVTTQPDVDGIPATLDELTNAFLAL